MPRRLIALLVLFSLAAARPGAAQQPSGAGRYGMHVGNDTDVAAAIPVLRDLGVEWVRLWADVEYAKRQEHTPSFERARAFKKAGFRVILLVSSNARDGAEPPRYEDVKAYFDWAQAAPGMKEAVDVWEISNELNLRKYWKYTPAQYVDNVLKAAWYSLHAGGETVLGGSFTAWQNDKISTEVTRQYVEAGYLKYCDYAGLHPYANTLADVQKVTEEALRLYGSKPVIFGEWNYKEDPFRNDWNQWARMLTEAKSYFDTQPRIKVICLYRLIQTPREGGWPGFVKNGTPYAPQQPFYDTLRSWRAAAKTSE
ncbi:hypothetical protein [Hymenobacter sp.]|uniref:hypothetical protein n=1 Tax=Hymenobacter sp. TaxID=1898978 RepID=UPI00286C4048|nr:hypothetical protein [Hymenobacter sp.]